MTNVMLRASALIMIVLFGYLLKRKNVVSMSAVPILSTLVINITLPGAIVTSYSKLNVEPSMITLVFIGLLCNVIMVFIGYLLAIRKSKERKAFNMINLAGYNIGSFTLPYVQNFFGPECILSVCLFDTGNAFMGAGTTYSLAAAVAGREKPGIKVLLKNIFTSVPILFYVGMTTFSVLHIQLPRFVLSVAEVAGAATPFLSMFIIGVAFELHLSKSQLWRITKLLSLRYAMSAIFAVGFYFLLPFSEEIRQGLVLVCFSPLSALCPIFTAKLDGDTNLSGSLNSISIVVGLVLMTGIIFFMQRGALP